VTRELPLDLAPIRLGGFVCTADHAELWRAAERSRTGDPLLNLRPDRPCDWPTLEQRALTCSQAASSSLPARTRASPAELIIWMIRLHLDVADQAAANQTALLEEQALCSLRFAASSCYPALEVGHIFRGQAHDPYPRVEQAGRVHRHVVVELAVAGMLAPESGRG